MLLWKNEEGKEIRVKAKDLQDNIAKIQMAINCAEEERSKTIGAIKDADFTYINTAEGLENYNRLNTRLKELNETINVLQDQEEKQFVILKKYKDSKFYIAPKDWLMIGGTTLLAVFIIALDRESPKITKLASFILKLFPMHI